MKINFKSVIDIGCATGIGLKAFEKKNYNTLGIDTDKTRINYGKKVLEESGILGLLLPQFRTIISDFIRLHIKEIKSFNKFGDRTFYPIFKEEFNFPKYSINYD